VELRDGGGGETQLSTRTIELRRDAGQYPRLPSISAEAIHRFFTPPAPDNVSFSLAPDFRRVPAIGALVKGPLAVKIGGGGRQND